MVLTEIKDWATAITGVAIIVQFVMIHWLRGQFVTKEEYRRASEKIEALEDRTAKAEAVIQHLPDQVSMHRMELAFEKMQGSMAVMAAEFKPIAATNSRLQEFLLSQAQVEKPPRASRRV